MSSLSRLGSGRSPAGGGKVGHCHVMIRDTAQAMAHEVYDTLMTRNDWYARWREANPGLGAKALEEAFVQKNWGKYVTSARATLAQMLATPLDPDIKESIMEALLLDNSLRRGRAQGGQTVMPLAKIN